jgi:hypothetical protein
MPLLILVLIAALLFFPRVRARLLEEIKTLSDFLVVGLFRRTSRFGSELTSDGKAEQNLWRQQRLRNLRGLALRAKNAVRNKSDRSKS